MNVEPGQPFRGTAQRWRVPQRGKENLWGCLPFFFFPLPKCGRALSVGRRKQCPRAAELGDPPAQTGCLCRSDSALASEPTVVPSVRLLTPLLKVKTVLENRISGTGGRNKVVSSPVHVPIAGLHPTSFSPSLSGGRLEKQSTTC